MFRMYFRYKLVLLLVSVHSTHGNAQNISTGPINTIESSCNDTSFEELDDCWKNLSSVSRRGIPANPQKVEKACGVFTTSMECINNWSRTCLSKEGQEKIENSITGAEQMYKYLCTDNKFREDYLKHANCYQRISPYWDDCNTKFTTNLKRIDHAKDTINLCCIRLRYMQCINNVTRVLCSDVAKKFLQSITESLMQSPFEAYHSSLCMNVKQQNCSNSSSSESSYKMLMISHVILCSFLNLLLAFWRIFHGLESVWKCIP